MSAVKVSASLKCLLAPNPSAYTMEGTNTWIWSGPVQGCVVVDPGPADRSHLDNILAELDAPLTAIVLTHDHSDHADGAADLAATTGAPILSWRTRRLDEAILNPLRIVHLPGHSADSIGIIFPDVGAIATGDTIFAEGSTLIDWPDSSLADYLETLTTLRRLVVDKGLTQILPGHGPIITNPLAKIDHYYAHRLERLDQVREVMDHSLDDIITLIYGDLSKELLEAAQANVQAQLEYLNP
ncbi:MAG: MBL fold metallo-hydrolase [Propionibacteriaceae bacterium]|jgi:glyoxylase-like metal-dependent hydrolase (beta-lactamase superfamily II)|nr:MBL fold metallo-hydrolase [Propionibacteriaceae bacterium]